MKKNNWKEVKLRDVCYPVSETFDLKNKSKIIFINTGDILEGKFLKSQYESTKSLPGQAKKRIKQNDILLSEIRPANKRYALVNFDSSDYVVSTKLMVLRAKESINLNFLYLLLTNKYTLNEFQHIAESRSGTFPQITFDAIAYYPILLPPLDEQKRIADILSSFDDKIELLQKQNKTLEDMAKVIFKSWFVDFDIVKAKERKEKKSKILNEYKITEEIYNLFPDSFEDSELGQIPKGWEIKKIETICDIFTGKKDVNQTVTNGKYVFFSCSPKTFLSNDFLYDGEAIIIAGNGSYTGRVSFYNGKFDLYQRTYACVSKNAKIMPLIYMFMKYCFEPKYMGGTRGSSIPYIVKGDISDFLICYSNSISNIFCKIINNFITKQQQNDKQIQTLTELRDALLPKLISGEIEV